MSIPLPTVGLCQDCRYWGATYQEATYQNDNGYRECWRGTRVEKLSQATEPYATIHKNGVGGALYTKPTFGCVLFEKKSGKTIDEVKCDLPDVPVKLLSGRIVMAKLSGRLMAMATVTVSHVHHGESYLRGQPWRDWKFEWRDVTNAINTGIPLLVD